MRPTLAYGLLFAVLFQGCAIYRPKAAIPSSFRAQVVADVGQKDLLSKYNSMPETNDTDKAAKVVRRNQILNELIYLVDINYSSFESHFYGGQAAFSTVGDAANLGLTAAGSVTGTAELKSILSATATGTTGLTSSVEKNFFDQQTRGAIVTKMRSLRALQLSTLQDAQHMKAGVSDYSLEQGIADVNAYYDAGTVVGALQGIAASVGTDTTATQAKQKENTATTQKIQ